MATFAEKMKARAEAVKASALAIKEEITAIAAPEDVRETRMSICESCEFLFTPTMQCKKCGCFVKAKTAVAMFSCPLNKWIAIKAE